MSMQGLTAACFVLVLGGSACRTSQPPAADWSYAGRTGPEHWAELKPEYALAGTGRRQSPIDIDVERTVASDGRPLLLDYHATTLEVLNNGHTVEDDAHGGGRLSVDGHAYELAQFHFHSPSEHTLDGQHVPIEMHLVHRDAAGALAVVAVMIREGSTNPALARLERHMPTQPGRASHVEGVMIDAGELLPASLASYRYSGSLTTPPCSEDVSWFVLREPIEASSQQIEAFRKVYSGNNRPTQPLNGRVVAVVE